MVDGVYIFVCFDGQQKVGSLRRAGCTPVATVVYGMCCEEHWEVSSIQQYDVLWIIPYHIVPIQFSFQATVLGRLDSSKQDTGLYQGSTELKSESALAVLFRG